MAEPTTLRGVIDFFSEFGIYDVVLPFILVFTIIFAILEKTKVLGTEEREGKRYPKRNIDAVVSLVIGFLVVASSKLVAAINKAFANVAILIFVSVAFLILIGIFYREGEEVFLGGGWKTFLMFIMFIGIIVIFLGSFGFLSNFWDWLTRAWKTQLVGGIILLIVVVLLIWFVVGGNKPKKTGSPE